MRLKRIWMLLLTLAVACSGTNPHRASARSVETMLQESMQEEEVTEEMLAFETVSDAVIRLQEEENREKNDRIASRNAIRVQMALQDEQRRMISEKNMKSEAHDLARQEAAEAAGRTKRLKLTQNEIKILYQIVHAEAGDQSLKGRIMIVNVIMNRVRSEYFPNNVRDVVFQKAQFSPVGSGGYYKAEPDELTRRAVQAAINGEDYSNGALYFCMKSLERQFARHATWVAAEGDHVFFR